MKVALLVASCNLICGFAHGIVTVAAAAPTTDVLTFTDASNIFSRIFPLTGTAPAPIAGNNNHARGQLFSLPSAAPGSGFELTGVTIRKNRNDTFIGDLMTLSIFNGTAAQWITGTGHVATDPDFFGGTSVTSLTTEVFTLNGTIAANDYVTFQLTNPIVVPDSSDFGFIFSYDPATSGSPEFFQYSEGNAGGRLSVTTTAHATSARNMNFYILGTPIPEPSRALLLSLGLLGVMSVRRR